MKTDDKSYPVCLKMTTYSGPLFSTPMSFMKTCQRISFWHYNHYVLLWWKGYVPTIEWIRIFFPWECYVISLVQIGRKIKSPRWIFTPSLLSLLVQIQISFNKGCFLPNLVEKEILNYRHHMCTNVYREIFTSLHNTLTGLWFIEEAFNGDFIHHWEVCLIVLTWSQQSYTVGNITCNKNN